MRVAERGQRPRALRRLAALVLVCFASTCGALRPTRGDDDQRSLDAMLPLPDGAVRIATFNVALAGTRAGEMQERLKGGTDPQARAVAEIIQRVRPHVILLNELDYTPEADLAGVFVERYLKVPQDCFDLGAGAPIDFPHRFAAPVNTGLASGFDLDHDGQAAQTPGTDQYANDAWGYGRYLGQYGMAVLSQFPLEVEKARTFQHFPWSSMPGALLPTDPSEGGKAWYSASAQQQFPLSSKSHWDLPVVVQGHRLHLLASHPTPPVFDGPEDRNGRRNHDEIRFWADYLSPDRAGYIVDDRGSTGGLDKTARFVILGDLNSDPADGDDARYPIRQLLGHRRVAAGLEPRSAGGRESAQAQGGANLRHRGDPAADTSDLVDREGPGNLRLDYVLPSRLLRVVGGGVFWPPRSDPRWQLVGEGKTVVSSDHRLVWIDITFDEDRSRMRSER